MLRMPTISTEQNKAHSSPCLKFIKLSGLDKVSSGTKNKINLWQLQKSWQAKRGGQGKVPWRFRSTVHLHQHTRLQISAWLWGCAKMPDSRTTQDRFATTSQKLFKQQPLSVPKPTNHLPAEALDNSPISSSRTGFRWCGPFISSLCLTQACLHPCHRACTTVLP